MRDCLYLSLGRYLSGAAAIVALLPPAAQARPIDRSARFPVIHTGNVLDPAVRNPWHLDPGVMTGAQAGTTWFGGTVWAADSMRWEAIEGQLWTFDTGVGSAIVPPGGPGDLSEPLRSWVDPFKQPGLHASMEGWVGFDRSYAETPYFRRLGSSDPRWEGAVCVGAAAGMGGSYSFWVGVLPEEARAVCYQSGQGYGNSWNVCIEQAFTYTGGPMNLGFRYKLDAEDAFDFVIVRVDTSGLGDDVEAVSYTGTASGTAGLILTQGAELPDVVPAGIKIKFCFESDGAWSDADGLYPTACGAFAVDDITISGSGISHAADFEAEAVPDADGEHDGWALSPPRPGIGGEWANLADLGELPPPSTPCSCDLEDSVLVFFDAANGHPFYQDNLAASPWIDLEAAGLTGSPGKIVRTNLYADLRIRNFIFAQFYVQWYPMTCPGTGKLIMSPWTTDGFAYNFSELPTCTVAGVSEGFQLDWSTLIPPEAEQVRLAVGVLNYCRFFPNCTGLNNSTPWFDKVGFGVYGTPGAPAIATRETERPQDNFPEIPISSLVVPGRVDCSRVQLNGGSSSFSCLGDTLVARGGLGNAEVYAHFRAIRGPGTSQAAFDAWWNRHPDSFVEPGFKVARCDTAERGGSIPAPGFWMTAYHESDPNFTGTDRDIDPSDGAPNGGYWRLKNDIFPDNLFTPGSRLEIFYTTNRIGETAFNRDPPAPRVHEMEILPSSLNGDGSSNCVLYVNRAPGDARSYIEQGLLEVLGGGSANPEGTNWDRFDVNAPGTTAMSFGRPRGAEYGAEASVLLPTYKVILWNTGDQGSANLTEEDGAVLDAWLDGLDCSDWVGGWGCVYFGNNKLYLSGDGLVHSALSDPASPPSVRELMEEKAGVILRPACSAGSYRLADCPAMGSPVDPTPCVGVVPTTDAPVAGSNNGRAVPHVAQGNGCPEQRSFDVLLAQTPEWGITTGDELYQSPIKSARFASVATDASPGLVKNYRIVVDGVSVHERRDDGTPCDYWLGGTTAVTERLLEVLNYFGLSAGTLCQNIVTGVEPEPPIRVFSLGGLSPNPLTAGAQGRIRYSLLAEGPVRLGVYDLQGRLVKRVLDGVAPAGDSEAFWDGRDETGAPVGSGVYFLRLTSGEREQSRRVVVLGE